MRGGGILRKRALEDERLDSSASARGLAVALVAGGLAAALVAGGLVAALAAKDSVAALVGGQFGGYVVRQAAWQPRGLHVAGQRWRACGWLSGGRGRAGEFAE